MSDTAGQVVKAWDPFWGKKGRNNTATNNSAGSVLGSITGTIASAGTGLQSTTAAISKSTITHAKRYERIINSNIGNNLKGVATGITQTNTLILNSLDNFSDTIRKNLEPISDFTGSTLGTLTGMVKDPLGTNGLGNVMTNLLNNISPGYGDKVNGTVTNLNLEALTNLPGQIFSSVDHLITAVDNILAIPLAFLSEIYYGYMAIMQAISDLISSLVNGFIEFFFDFLDSIIPIKSILALLSAVSDLANQIGGIASIFLGANAITGFANQITGFTRQISNVLNNPLDLIVSKLPTEVTGFINTLQNPQQFINNILPPELSQAFSKISSITGFGFNGNMGYGFQSVLDGLQGGVIRSILTNFAGQYSVLGPLLAGTGNNTSTGPTGFDTQLVGGQYNQGYVDETKREPQSQYSGTE